MTAEILGFLGGHPGRMAVFEAVESAVAALGESAVEVKKSQISWKNPRLFAAVSLPRRAGQEDSLVLTFGLGRRLENPRILQAVEPYPGRWTHHVVLTGPGDVDGEITEFLAEAYWFAQAKGRRK